MAIITISRGSYSKGKEVAERVASRLGIQVHQQGGPLGCQRTLSYS